MEKHSISYRTEKKSKRAFRLWNSTHWRSR